MLENILHHRTITASLNKNLIAEVLGKYLAIDVRKQYGRDAVLDYILHYISIILCKNAKYLVQIIPELKVSASFTVATSLTVLLAAKEQALYDLEYPPLPVY